MTDDKTLGQLTDRELRLVTDRELLLRTAVKIEGIEKDIKALCSDRKQHDQRITELEKKEAHREGTEESVKDSHATTIAIVAIVISVVATIANIIGG